MKAVVTLAFGVTLAALGAQAQQDAAQASGAVLRVLEKVSGEIFDLDMRNGASQETGRLIITLRDCRYPLDNPTGDAFAFVTVRERGRSELVFEGWMIASSPALNAMEHPRYDVWVLRCKTE